MANIYDKIRKRKREEHRRKMEEERRIEEEQRKAEEQQSAKNSVSNNENDGFSRIYGDFGWKLSNKEDKDTSGSAVDVNDKVVPPAPAAKRSLAQSSDSSHQAPKADSSLSKRPSANHISFELPLSDVTRSQSPSKPTTKQSPGRLAKPAATVKKPAAKDDPIMALMMQVEARKNKSKDTSDGALPVHLASPTKRVKADPMDILRRRSKESPTVPNARLDPMIAQSPVHLASPTKRMKADPMDILRRRSKESPAGTNARHDPMDIARKKEKERAMRKEKEEPQCGKVKEVEASPKAEAKHPLALTRNEDQRSFSPPGHKKGSRPVALPDASDGNDDSTIVTDNRKKPAARMTSSQARTEPSPKKKGGLKAAPRSGRSRNDDDSDDYSSDTESDGGHVDGEQDDTLIPTFDDPKMGPPSALEPLELPRGTDQTIGHTIPASINRYLRGYQQQGVIFMYSCIMRKSGGILGDDMGLGKTVQVISLLAALFGKTGTGKDASDLQRRGRLISQQLREIEAAKDRALLLNEARLNDPWESVEIEGLSKPEWAPVLVIVPSSVIDNWMNEFRAWGHFGVAVYKGAEAEKDKALRKVQYGTDEILLCSRSLATSKCAELSMVAWKLVVVDEIHIYKNHKSNTNKKLRELRDACRCPIIGMTGTVMQNRPEELFNLVDVVAPGLLGERVAFEEDIAKPIKLARAKDADEATIQRGAVVQDSLDGKLEQVYIHRTKESELGEELPEKNETVLFCEPTEIQKALYQHILTTPDYELLRYSNSPCDCGVNRDIFVAYKRLRTREEKVNFLRRCRDNDRIAPRKRCCFRTPLNPNRGSEGEPVANPRAVLWRAQHEDDEECPETKKPGCPHCISFACLHRLNLVSSHAALILAERDPTSCELGSEEWKKTTKQVAFAKVAIPPHILAQLPGRDSNPYVLQDNVMSDHAKYSGKMDKLDKLLRVFDKGNNRVLLFSHYTKTLDIIQQFVTACGYSHVRLDGTTSTPERQKLVDRFQTDPTIFLFLLSTKAGGLGLNLTAANKVILFDLDFNPSHDEQAQDRSYRVGQDRDVQVVRLVSRGMYDELKYIRQVYKVHLKNDTVRDPQETGQKRVFRGVEGVNNGEVFGIENLLKFKDGSFMEELWRGDSHAAGKDETVDVGELEDSLKSLSDEQVENIGGDAFVEDFDVVATSHKDGEDNDGTARQTVDRDDAGLMQGDGEGNSGDAKRSSVDVPPVDDDEEEVIDVVEVTGVENAINHQDLFRAAEQDSEEEEEEEVLGGASQNALAFFDRERSDVDSDEDE